MALLPSQFADLEPFAETWCLSSEIERYARRLDSTMADMLAFYDAANPRMESAMTYLEQCPLEDLPEDATNLLHLLYSLITVSFPAEAWGQARVPDTGSASFDCIVEPTP